jgi:replication-associated recombination protein RarA
MSYNWSDQVTQGGYNFSEVVSALQKCIRRGLEREAMHWAIEIESIQAKYLWNRLKIIASEDIGIADSSIAVLVATLSQNYEDALKRGNDAYRLFLGHAILAMCRAEKSRIVDNFVIATYMNTDKPPIPDVALDKHTRRGRTLKRSWEHFFDEGVKVSPEKFMDKNSDYEAETISHLQAGHKFKYAKEKSATPAPKPQNKTAKPSQAPLSSKSDLPSSTKKIDTSTHLYEQSLFDEE